MNRALTALTAAGLLGVLVVPSVSAADPPRPAPVKPLPNQMFEKLLDRTIYLVPLLFLGVSDAALLVLAGVDAAVSTFSHSNLDWRIGPLGVRWSIGDRVWVGILAFASLIAGAMGFGYKLGRLYMPAHSEMSAETGNPPAAAESMSEAQSRFQRWSLLPATVAGFLFVWLALQGTTPAVGLMQAHAECVLHPPGALIQSVPGVRERSAASMNFSGNVRRLLN